jgi:hypothetical protein
VVLAHVPLERLAQVLAYGGRDLVGDHGGSSPGGGVPAHRTGPRGSREPPAGVPLTIELTLANTGASCQDGYAASAGHLAQVSLATDNVFSDGADLQLASVSGDAVDGLVATLAVGVAG